jgi:hypothetical protein
MEFFISGRLETLNLLPRSYPLILFLLKFLCGLIAAGWSGSDSVIEQDFTLNHVSCDYSVS